MLQNRSQDFSKIDNLVTLTQTTPCYFSAVPKHEVVDQRREHAHRHGVWAHGQLRLLLGPGNAKIYLFNGLDHAGLDVSIEQLMVILIGMCQLPTSSASCLQRNHQNEVP